MNLLKKTKFEIKKKIIVRNLNELKNMKEQSNSDALKWLGFNLTKKRAILLRVLSSIFSASIPLILIDSLWVLKYNNTTVFLDDKLIYFYISLLILSNFIASIIVLWICIYTFKKTRIFMKLLKLQ